MKTIDLITCAFLFILFLGFAQLSVRALDIEAQGNQQVVNDHKAYLASHQTKE